MHLRNILTEVSKQKNRQKGTQFKKGNKRQNRKCSQGISTGTATGKRPKWLLPIILSAVIAGCLFGVYYFTTDNSPMPDTVVVTGSVASNRAGAVPEKIVFTCQSSGSRFVSEVLGGNAGNYSVTLPNRHYYAVTVTWATSGVDGGTLTTDTLDLFSTESSLEVNWTGS